MPHHSRGRRSMALSMSCAACLATALLAAQQPVQIAPAQTTFRSAIQLVQVDVVVVDDRGEHVRGLTAGDFQIFDRARITPRPLCAPRSPRRSGRGGEPSSLARRQHGRNDSR